MLNRLDGTWGVEAGFGFRTSTYCPLAPRHRKTNPGFNSKFSKGNKKTFYFSEGSNKLFKGGNYYSPLQNVFLPNGSLMNRFYSFKRFSFIFFRTIKTFIL